MVEDQVDAVVCAYVALFADARPEDTTTYGDLETGYIVTPTLPDGLDAEPAAARGPGRGRRPGPRVRPAPPRAASLPASSSSRW